MDEGELVKHMTSTFVFGVDLSIYQPLAPARRLPSPNPTEWQEPRPDRLWFRAHKEESDRSAPIRVGVSEHVRCEKMLAEINVKPVFGTQFKFELGQKSHSVLGPGWTVAIKVSAPDRNDPVHKIYLRFPVFVMAEAFSARMLLARVVREALVEWVIPHEVDEMIEIDGNRVFDPHAPGGMDWSST